MPEPRVVVLAPVLRPVRGKKRPRRLPEPRHLPSAEAERPYEQDLADPDAEPWAPEWEPPEDHYLALWLALPPDERARVEALEEAGISRATRQKMNIQEMNTQEINSL
ncbi:hypothetical protein DYH09_13860 [bacterium CPR1]|nr:hypothetical protein [bacterium CPR1]